MWGGADQEQTDDEPSDFADDEMKVEADLRREITELNGKITDLKRVNEEKSLQIADLKRSHEKEISDLKREIEALKLAALQTNEPNQ